MIFTETPLRGAWLIDPEPVEDERGFFARTYCRTEFERHGLNPNLVQCNLSFNRKKGTLRGMHYQVAPRQEAKVVWCVSGAVFDVIVDLRPESPTYRRSFAVELSAGTQRMLYIPEGLAHGFQTLRDDSSLFYQMSEFYAPECARGARWNDPAFGIRWPAAPAVISPKDAAYPDFES